MSRIAFFCIPAHGHTNPTLAVVKELIARGNEVRYYSYESMRDKIEKTGAEYISCDQCDVGMKLSDDDGKRIATDLAFAAEVIVSTTLAMDQALLTQMKAWKPDCIVADSMAFWGKLIAMKLGVPFVSSTTTFAYNRYSAKMMQKNSGGLWKQIFSMIKAQKSVKKLQKAGYPVKNILSIIANDNDTDTVVYTSPEFQPYAETFSDRYAFVGPSIREETGETPLLKKPLLYLSLGTILNKNLDFYRRCIDAFGGKELQVLISVGDRRDIAAMGSLPPNIHVEKTVDQIAVLKQADAFLTHCGMNSVSEALYFGVPLILFPQTPEESAVAYRVKEMGAGLDLSEDSAEGLARAVRKVLENPRYRQGAKQVAESFARCGGAKAAADKIMTIAKKA